MILNRLLPILVFAALLALGSGGAAAQTSRLYLAGYMGLNTHPRLAFTEESIPIAGKIEPKNAFSFAGALGLRIDNNWRVETELSYRAADLGTMDVKNIGAFNVGGDMSTYLLMANAYYDFDLNWKKVMPFVTAGLGVAFHDVNLDDSTGNATDASDSDFGVAWQVGGGVKYRVTDDMAFSGGYRYLGTTDVGYRGYNMDYSTHEFRLGLEYDLPIK